MVNLRRPRESDADIISELLTALGYAKTQTFICARVAQLLAHPEEELLEDV